MRVPGRITASSARLRVLATGLILLLALSFVGCGETYRPVAQPIAGRQPSPGAAHTVIAINTDGVGDNHRSNGTASDINVSGDSIQGNLIAGLAPVHGALTPNGATLYVANSGQDTVTANRTSAPTTAAATVSLPPSASAPITQVSANGSTATYTYTGSGLFSAGDTIYVSGCSTAGFNGMFAVTGAGGNTFSASNSTASTGADCSNALAKVPNAVFANTTDNNNMYVAGYGTNLVYVINTSTNVVSASIPVGAHPVSLAETPDNRKVYVANHGNSGIAGSVSVIDTSTATLSNTICLAGGTPPSCNAGPAAVWAVARSDSAELFILDASGTIYVIDTASDAVIDSAQSAGAGANFMFFDKNFSRLFVTNPASATLSIFDASGSVLAVHPGNPIAIPAAATPCATAPVPQSVTVLGDGTRAYVASYQVDAGTVCTQLSVVDAGSGTLTKNIPLAQAADTSAQTGCGSVGFRVFAAASGGGTNSSFKVYVSQCDAGSIAVVNTYAVDGNAADTYAGVALPGPLSTFPPLSTGIPPSQNPVFLVAGP